MEKDRKPLEYLERLWGQALTAMSTVEEEATKVAGRLSEAAGWSQDEVRKHVRDFADRLGQQRKALEENLDDGVRKALGRVRLPRREEIAELNARLDRIAQRIDDFQENR